MSTCVKATQITLPLPFFYRQALTDEQVENLQLDAEHPELEQGFKLSTSKNKILDISKSK